ncbi:hypothetical protein IGI04_028140 [Brassica rapa subsp. trilocularis]|uniref:Uncharacterized protein n=1 Tax=Brassica rapa subsp. trilocularis TaxID=1813537 RepID=A0ABQ7L181_BRACM|nr:hypothetical protein IGI04_028140 [Brassica rapa subsp. trilocularis]
MLQLQHNNGEKYLQLQHTISDLSLKQQMIYTALPYLARLNPSVFLSGFGDHTAVLVASLMLRVSETNLSRVVIVASFIPPPCDPLDSIGKAKGKNYSETLLAEEETLDLFGVVEKLNQRTETEDRSQVVVLILLRSDMQVMVRRRPSFVLAAARANGDVSHGSTSCPVPLTVPAEVTWLAHVVVVVVTEFGVCAFAPRTWKYLVRFLEILELIGDKISDAAFGGSLRWDNV